MKIKAERGKANKIHILCDGEYTYTVDADFWYSCPYRSVQSIDDEQELAEFNFSVGSRCAFNAGLRLLGYGDHSKKELTRRLVQKGHSKECAEAAADRLEELGYIDDERCAENLARTLSERKGMSAKRVACELIRKGIPREIAYNAASGLDFDPILRIIELLNTKYSRSLSDEKGVKRTIASLQRLGYGWSDIKSALRQAELETEDFDDV